MTNVKIQKIPMKDLSPKELAELAFDMGVTRGGSRTANTLKRGGLKRGAYGQGVGKYKDGGDVKYKGPLPKSKPKMTPIEKFTGKRSVNKSLSEEEKKYIGDKMSGKVVAKMKDGGAAFPDLTGDGKVTKKDILKGRGVKGFEDGGSAKTTEMSPEILETIRDNEKSGKTFKPKKMEPDKSTSKKGKKDAPNFMKPAGFEDGGEVRGMGRAYMGVSRKAKIR